MNTQDRNVNPVVRSVIHISEPLKRLLGDRHIGFFARLVGLRALNVNEPRVGLGVQDVANFRRM